jgi:hypothetical protein
VRLKSERFGPIAGKTVNIAFQKRICLRDSRFLLSFDPHLQELLLSKFRIAQFRSIYHGHTCFQDMKRKKDGLDLKEGMAFSWCLDTGHGYDKRCSANRHVSGGITSVI